MGVVKVSGRIIPAFAKQHGPPCNGLVLTPSLGLTKMALITKITRFGFDIVRTWHLASLARSMTVAR